MDEKLVIIVKLANQSSEDQRVECDLDWNVLLLKEKIFEVHPLKPSVKDQKLIYSGQLLQDSHLLKTALRHHTTENNEYIVHMVCSGSKLHVPNVAEAFQEPILDTNVSEPNRDALTDVRRRVIGEQSVLYSASNTSADSSSIYSPHVPQMPPAITALTDPMEQMVAIQQMYAQYMTSYLQYIQSGTVDLGSTVNTFGVTGSNGGNLSDNSGRGPVGEANNNEAPQREGPANPQAALMDDDEGMMRDWLDYIYFGTRLCVLFSIVFFYSTFSRFILVASVTSLIYLYQCGWFRFGNGEELNPPTPELRTPPPAAPPSATPETEDTEVNEGSEDPSAASTPSSNTPSPPLPPQPSLVALSWTFLSTFFSSLIPDQQQLF